MKQNSSSKMLNSTFFIDDEFMTAIITSKSWDFLKRKTDTIKLNEDDRIEIHDKTIFILISTWLIIL